MFWNCMYIFCKKTGEYPELCGTIPLCQTRIWPNNGELDCMSNYPDTCPKLHQILQLESVKVKLFQCFSGAMYSDNSCSGFWDGAE